MFLYHSKGLVLYDSCGRLYSVQLVLFCVCADCVVQPKMGKMKKSERINTTQTGQNKKSKTKRNETKRNETKNKTCKQR